MSSSQKEALRLQLVGQACYRKKDYTAAIAEFTKALQLRNVPFTVQISILDNRAAAREKIGGTANLELALQDARMMTQLSKVQAAGYLRAGKVFQLLNRDESALDIYAYGIKQVKPDSPQFETLNKMFKKVKDRVALGEVRDTRRDPLNHLPVELAESVLQYLPFGDLMIVQRVSRAWRSFIHASRKTYTCLDFSAAQRDVPRSSLRAYISRSGGNVRGAVLFRCSGDPALSILAHRCRQLSILRIRHSQITPGVLLKETRILPNLAVLITDLRFRVDSFREILEGCASLRTFECGGFISASSVKAFTANLRRLKIWEGGVTLVPTFSLAELSRVTVECLPKLEEFEILGSFFSSTVDFRSPESLSVLVLHRSRITAFPLLPESIRVLDISENAVIRWSMQDLAASPLPNLETFKADYSPLINNEHVLAILAPSLEKRSLRSLSLHMCPNMDFSSLEWLMEHGENLEELAIGGNCTVADEMSIEVAAFKKLRYLRLPFSNISGIGLLNVVHGSQGVLREVDISGCMNIGLDAVQLAAKSGAKPIQRKGS